MKAGPADALRRVGLETIGLMEVVQSPVEDAGRLFAIAQRPLEIDLVHDDVGPFLMEIDDAFLAVAVDDEDCWRFLIGREPKPGFNAVVEDGTVGFEREEPL